MILTSMPMIMMLPYCCYPRRMWRPCTMPTSTDGTIGESHKPGGLSSSTMSRLLITSMYSWIVILYPYPYPCLCPLTHTCLHHPQMHTEKNIPKLTEPHYSHHILDLLVVWMRKRWSLSLFHVLWSHSPARHEEGEGRWILPPLILPAAMVTGVIMGYVG